MPVFGESWSGMKLRCVLFSDSISGAVSGGSTLLSVLTLVKFELVAMMVLALLFAATELECGLAPLEHGLLCGLAHVGLGPRQCAVTLVLPCGVCGCGDGFWNPRCRGFCLRGCFGA